MNVRLGITILGILVLGIIISGCTDNVGRSPVNNINTESTATTMPTTDLPKQQIYIEYKYQILDKIPYKPGYTGYNSEGDFMYPEDGYEYLVIMMNIKNVGYSSFWYHDMGWWVTVSTKDNPNTYYDSHDNFTADNNYGSPDAELEDGGYLDAQIVREVPKNWYKFKIRGNGGEYFNWKFIGNETEISK